MCVKIHKADKNWTIQWSSLWTTATAVLFLGLMWGYLLSRRAGPGDRWVFFAVFVPFIVVAVGILFKSDWASQTIRLLSWIGATVGGCLTLMLVIYLPRESWSFAITIALPFATTTAVSLRNLFWMGDLAVPRQFGLKHLLAMIGMIAAFTGAVTAVGYVDACVILFQLLVVGLLIRSVHVLRHPNSIRTPWQATYHTVMIAVTAVFPVTALFALTFGLPIFMYGWQKLGWYAALTGTPGWLGGWTVMSGGLIWLIPILIGVVWGLLWWKQPQRKPEIPESNRDD